MTSRPAHSLAIALAQLNPTVGDMAGNAAKVRVARAQAKGEGADLVVFPELCISGCPLEGLALQPAFQAACRATVESLARDTADGGPALLIGTPWVEAGKLYNAVCLLDAGRIAALRFKVNFPSRGVFSEADVFTAGPMPGPVSFRGVRLGIPVGDDIASDEVVECVAETGAELLIVPGASLYWRGRDDVRLSMAVARVTESGLPLIAVNQVGGQDEFVFDGASFALHDDCSLALQLPAFAESIVTTRWGRQADGWRCVDGPVAPAQDDERSDYSACVLALRDYTAKRGFPGVLVALSGDVDSALCAAMAVDALGPECVTAFVLPGRAVPASVLADAKGIADRLGIKCSVLPIEPALNGIEQAIASALTDGTTEKSIEGHARSAMLAALADRLGLILVHASNKSQFLIGHATLSGDANAFNPIKDLHGSEVQKLAHLRNAWRPADARGADGVVIPENVVASALADQDGADALPSYEVLDAILGRLVERGEAVADVAAAGFDREIVARVAGLIFSAECRRRLTAPGPRITLQSVSGGLRYPIANRFTDTGENLPPPDATLYPPPLTTRTDPVDF